MIIVVVKKTKEFKHSQYVYKTSIAVSDIIWCLCLCIMIGFGLYFYSNIFIECQRPNITYNTYNDLTVSTVVYVNCELTTNIHFKLLSLLYFFLSFCLTIFVLASISISISLVTLIFAAADRYFAIAFPFRYRSTNTIKMAKIISTIIWITSTFLHIVTFVYAINENKAVAILFQPSYEQESFFGQSPNQDFATVLGFVLFSLLWLFTVLTLISLYKTYKRSLKLNRSVKAKVAPEKQMSIVLVAMVIAFTFSLFPTLLNHILIYTNKINDLKSIKGALIRTAVALSFLYTNPVWNVLIHNVLNKQFRVALKALFKSKKNLLKDEKIALKNLGTKSAKKQFAYRVIEEDAL